jgi:hypothetical protein
MFDTQTQNRGTSTSASMKKASSTTNIADDLSAIFGGGTNYSSVLIILLYRCSLTHDSNHVFDLFFLF